MTRKKLTIGGAGLATLAAAGIIAGIAVGAGPAGGDSEEPITGPALEQASDAALAQTGAGRVTDTEVGDEESLYEVEVTLPDGSEVDVQLDETFSVVGTEAEDGSDDESDDEDDENEPDDDSDEAGERP